jgi:endonuclease YncB( thermonuclease family)
MMKVLLTLSLLTFSPRAAAQALTGIARSADGESLTVSEQGIRLFGIDAPEYQQTCDVSSTAWARGADAAAALQSTIDG